MNKKESQIQNEKLCCEKTDNSYDIYIKCFRHKLDKEFHEKQIEGVVRISKDVIKQVGNDSGIKNSIEHIVSIGCGTGEEIFYLAALNPGIKFYGIDNSIKSVMAAIEQKNNIEAFFREMDFDGIKDDSNKPEGKAFTETLKEKLKEFKTNESNLPFLENLCALAEKSGNSKELLLYNLYECKGNIKFAIIGNQNGSADNYIASYEDINFSSEIMESTLFLFLGHTYTHLTGQLKDEILEKMSPKLLFIDFHENWDSAIQELRENKNENLVFNPRGWIEKQKILFDFPCGRDKCIKIIAEDCKDFKRLTIGMATTRSKGGGLVERGLAYTKNDGAVNIFLPSTQREITSSEAIKEICKERYLPIDTLEYTVGYGHMHGTLFWHIDNDEEIGRKAIYETFRDHVYPEMFLNDGKLNHLFLSSIKYFNGWLLSAIMGTDRFISIASYCHFYGKKNKFKFKGKKAGEVPEKISKLLDSIEQSGKNQFSYLKDNPWMIIQPFSATQQLLPTADGIYYLLLHSPVGALVTPPSEAKREYMVEVDRYFGEHIELKAGNRNAKRIGACDPPDDTYTRESPWLAIPVYYGSMPLFLLFLRKARETNELNLSKTFLTSFACEVNNICKRVFSDILNDSFMSDYLNKIINELLKDGRYNNDGISGDMILKDAEDIAKKCIENTLEKPWKSWVVDFPELCIKDRPESISENEKIWEAFNYRAELNKSNERLKVSKWFQKCDFFSNEKGNEHKCVTWQHFIRLSETDNFNESNTCIDSKDPSRTKCGSEIKVGCKNGNSEIEESIIKGNFNNLKEFVIRDMESYGIDKVYREWVSDYISKLPVVADMKITTSSSKEEPLSIKCKRYQKLKSLFCRSIENTGSYFRYSGFSVITLLELEYKRHEKVQSIKEPPKFRYIKVPSMGLDDYSFLYSPDNVYDKIIQPICQVMNFYYDVFVPTEFCLIEKFNSKESCWDCTIKIDIDLKKDLTYECGDEQKPITKIINLFNGANLSDVLYSKLKKSENEKDGNGSKGVDKAHYLQFTFKVKKYKGNIERYIKEDKNRE